MKKINTLFFFFTLLLYQLPLVAQEDVADDSQAAQPLFQASTGLGGQLFYPAFKTTYFSVEKPVGPYRQMGLVANVPLPSYAIYTYDVGIGKNSFEAGVFYKNFFRGRLSGRRSPFYIGVDVRAGKRTYFENQSFFGTTPNYREMGATNLKFMLLTGIQYRIGSALLEFALPIGVERVGTKAPSSERVDSYYFMDALGTNVLVLPSIGLGYAFYRPAKTKKSHRKH